MKQNFFFRLSRRNKFISYIVIVVMAGFLLNKVLLRPVMKRLDMINEDIVLQERKLENSLSLLLKEDLLAKRYEEITGSVAQGKSDDEETACLLSEIEKLAKECSVFISDIKSIPVENIESYRKYTVTIEAESEIPYLVDFLYRLEKSSRMLRVRNFSLTSKEKESGILKGQITITQILIVSPVLSTEEEQPKN